MAGRKKKTLISTLKSIYWFKQLLIASGKQNPNELGEWLYGKGENDNTKALYKYQSGVYSISEMSLNLTQQTLDNRKVNIDSKKLIEIGPQINNGQHVPLWDALSGSAETLEKILISYDPEVAIQKYLKVGFELRCSSILYKFFGTTDYGQVLRNINNRENLIAKNIFEGNLVIDFSALVQVICAWRLAHFFGEAIEEFDYILAGLFYKAIPALFDDQHIFNIFKQIILDLDSKHYQGIDEAIDIINQTRNIYPSSLHVGNTTEDSYSFLKDIALNRSLSSAINRFYP